LPASKDHIIIGRRRYHSDSLSSGGNKSRHENRRCSAAARGSSSIVTDHIQATSVLTSDGSGRQVGLAVINRCAACSTLGDEAVGTWPRNSGRLGGWRFLGSSGGQGGPEYRLAVAPSAASSGHRRSCSRSCAARNSRIAALRETWIRPLTRTSCTRYPRIQEADRIGCWPQR
jgi:hypothetical protein